MFVRTEVAKLCEPTLHYTYIDGRSCIEEPNFLASAANYYQSNDGSPMPVLVGSVETTASQL